MSRLFVFGCSFTNYVWPTWADLLSLEFDYYENWGIPGIGNRAILERLTECHIRNKLTKDDTVIVQWSSHLRNDWYKDFYNKDIGNIEGWVVEFESPLWTISEQVYKKIFSERAFVLHTLNHIVLAQSLLKSTDCRWFMTSMWDIKSLGYESKNIWDEYPEFKIYEEHIWKDYKNNWLPNLKDTIKKYPQLQWSFNDVVDNHPSPEQHQIWLNQYLRPKLELGNPLDIQKEIVDELTRFKKDNKITYDEFCNLSENTDLFDKRIKKSKKDYGF